MTGFTKAAACHESPHGCALVSDGLVCQDQCGKLEAEPPAPPPNPFPDNEGT
jgi:hypothetical protein